MRSSADYSILADTTESTGGCVTSQNYVIDITMGDFTGVATSDSGDYTEKVGYISQLYEVTGLEIHSSASSVTELASLQLDAAQLLDDESLIGLSATDVAWSVADGPIASIDADGLSSAGQVYQDTAASVQADYGGNTGVLDLTVLDSIPDNFGIYASDGLGDDWQVDNFGLDNPLAGPLMNPDGDSLINLHEFAFGTNPKAATASLLIDGSGTVSNPRGTPVSYLYGITAETVDFRAIFSRRTDYQEIGLNYTVQFSAGLDVWVDYPFGQDEPISMEVDSGIEAVYVRYPLIIQTANGFEKPRFFRVGVNPSSN